MAEQKPASAPEIVLGTMRWLETERSEDEWLAFLAHARARNIRKLHCSHEYESHPLVSKVVRRWHSENPDRQFDLIVKLATPHFDEERFSGDRLRQLVDQYRADYAVRQVADIQWMWRSNEGDATRVAGLRADAGNMRSAVQQLKSAGDIKRFLCFPYSTAFADAAKEFEFFDGLVVYRNEQEKEYDTQIDQWFETGRPTLIIRPFFAGQLLDPAADAAALLRAAVDRPGIESAILSTSNPLHLDDLVQRLA